MWREKRREARVKGERDGKGKGEREWRRGGAGVGGGQRSERI